MATRATAVRAPKTEPPAPPAKPAVSAVEMGARQREISVSEFFTKNRHLLGFDNPRKALLTCVKEAVDNALDACEEAGILPDVVVKLEVVGNGEPAPPASQASRFRITVADNGPGIVRQQIPPIFAKLLYGSKFHRLRMSRGQQGIGISAAGMYGQLTTGKPVQIISRTSGRTPAHYFEVQIDTKKNEPLILEKKQIEWEHSRGTQVTLEVEGRYQKGRASVDEYIEQTVIANPHVHPRVAKRQQIALYGRKQRNRIAARYRPQLDFGDAAVGNDVDRLPALDHPHLQGRAGWLELGVQGPLFEPATIGDDLGNDFRHGMDRIEPKVRAR